MPGYHLFYTTYCSRSYLTAGKDDRTAKHTEARSTSEPFTVIDEQFAAFGKRFGAFDQKLATMNEQFTAVDENLAAVNERMTAIPSAYSQFTVTDWRIGKLYCLDPIRTRLRTFYSIKKGIVGPFAP